MKNTGLQQSDRFKDHTDSKSSLGAEVGILSDIQILERLVAPDKKCIFVSPLLRALELIGPSSLDLRLGTEYIVTRNIEHSHIDLTQTDKKRIESQTEQYSEKRVLDAGGPLVLHPGEFVLAPTLEFIRLPLDIAGRLEGRSSFGRIGLQIHSTAGFVDPGFEGHLTFELMNSGKLPVRLKPGIRLGQICFFRVLDVQVGYLDKPFTKYGRLLGVGKTRIHQDPQFTRGH